MGNDVRVFRQPGGWLRSSHSFKECVIAHWSNAFARKMYRGSSIIPKLRVDIQLGVFAVGERRVGDTRSTERTVVVYTSENAGMSSVKHVRTMFPVNLRFPTEG